MQFECGVRVPESPADCVSGSPAVAVHLLQREGPRGVCDPRERGSGCGWRSPRAGGRARNRDSSCLSRGAGVCASGDKLGFPGWLRQRDRSIDREFGKQQPFLVTAHFSRPAFIIPAISLRVGAAPGQPRAAPEREGACEVGVPRGRVAGRQTGPSPGRRIYRPQPKPQREGSGSFENPLTPAVTPLGEAASPGATPYGKPEAVPRLKAKGPFISRAPASNWPFVH